MPRVSIGLPIFNGENFVELAIEALLAQTFTDFELVLVDNASTDRTADICRSFASRDSRVHYHRNARNIGGGPNFNLAFVLASRAPYFKWAAHDDLHQPEFLAECVARLDEDPGVVLCNTEAEIIDETGRVIRGYASGLDDIGSERPSARFRNLLLADHWALDGFGLMRRSALSKTRLCDGYVGSDRIMLAELGLRGRFHRVPRILFQSRDYSGRSIRTADLRSRAGWFNPKLDGKIVFPHWRYLLEYSRALWRTPLPLAERVECWRAVADWFRENFYDMRMDLRVAAERSRRRAAPKGQAA